MQYPLEPKPACQAAHQKLLPCLSPLATRLRLPTSQQAVTCRSVRQQRNVLNLLLTLTCTYALNRRPARASMQSVQHSRCLAAQHSSVSVIRPPLPLLSATACRLRRNSRVVTQAGLFGLNFGSASATDVKSKKQEVQYALHATRRVKFCFVEEVISELPLGAVIVSLCIVAHAYCNAKSCAVQLLAAIGPLQRGVTATDDDRKEVERLIQQLEKFNPNPKSLASPLINGKWRLIYTTSQSILQSKRPAVVRPNGPIYQFIGDDLFSADSFHKATESPLTESRLGCALTLAALMSAAEICLQMHQMARLGIRSHGHSSTRYKSQAPS